MTTQLVGKKQLLSWATEVTQVDVTKYDDLRDGLIPLMIFRALFPHGVSSEFSSHMRAQLSMTTMQRNSRQNWSVLQQLLRAGGVPPAVWDRRGVSSAHPKACYNFLVMAFFLHRLRDGPKDFSVDFALPIEVELSNFLQSPRSLEIVHRANAVRPVAASAMNLQHQQHHQQQQQQSGYESGESGFAGGSSADVTPIGTPRAGARQPHHHHHHHHGGGRAKSPSPAAVGADLSMAATDPQYNNNSLTIFVSPTSVGRNNSNKSPPRGNSPGRNAPGGGVGDGIKRISNIKDSGWRYGVETSNLGEVVIERLRADNARLHDAVAVSEEHGRATQAYCESQLTYAREHFDAEIKKVQLAAKLHGMQLEAQAALGTAMVGAAAEAKLRDFERKLDLEKRDMQWMTFADDLIPDSLLQQQGPNGAHQRERWLQAQLDAARKAAATERQHRLAVENENAVLREQSAKFLPLLSKLQREFLEAGEKVHEHCDPESAAINAELALRKVRDAAEAQYQSKIDSLGKQLEALQQSSSSAFQQQKDLDSTAGANSDAIKRLQVALFTAQEELARARETAARSEKSAALLREVLHHNCTTAMQRVDLSAMSVDPNSEEVARGITVLSGQLGSATSSGSEAVASQHISNICDLVSQWTASVIASSYSSSDGAGAGGGSKVATAIDEASARQLLDKVREQALRLGTMQQVLESRVAAMGRALRQVAANFVSLESESASRVLALQQQMAEQQQRHSADLQQMAAAKSSDAASLNSELALLKQQLQRAQEEHKDFSGRQHQAHQGMERDLMQQVNALRQAVSEARRAEALHLQRDQLYSALVDNLALVGSPSASAEHKFRAESKANQLREEIRKNSQELKGSIRSSQPLDSSHDNVAEAVKEAIAASHGQLEQLLQDVDAKARELRTLEHTHKLAVTELEAERGRASAFKDEKVLLAEELAQSRDEVAKLQTKLQHGDSVVAHAKEAMQVLVTDAVEYVESVASALLQQSSQQDGSVNSGGVIKNKPRSSSFGNNSSTSLNDLTTRLKTGGSSMLSSTGAGGGSGFVLGSSTAGGKKQDPPRQNMVLSFGGETSTNTSLSGAPAAPADTSSSSAAAASPPRLFAPKFAPIELSPPKQSKTPSGTAAAAAATASSSSSSPSSASATAAAAHSIGAANPQVNAAADGAIDDFARKQREILSKYGLK